MWAKPTKTDLAQIPTLYATEDISLADKKIYLHFFIGGCDWYITEYDKKDTMFGFAIINGDTQMAEWGYISLNELKNISVGPGIEVDTDKYWKIKPVKEIEKITACRLGIL